jgi:hypothetical protein
VHKLLVLDRWLAAGKVESIRDCVRRLRSNEADPRLVRAVVDASEEDEEEEDIYVVINKDLNSLPFAQDGSMMSINGSGYQGDHGSDETRVEGTGVEAKETMLDDLNEAKEFS